MKHPKLRGTLSLLFPLIIQTGWADKIKASDYTLNMVDWGEVITGDQGTKFNPSKIEDKVVTVEEFGFKTPADKALKEALESLNK